MLYVESPMRTTNASITTANTSSPIPWRHQASGSRSGSMAAASSRAPRPAHRALRRVRAFVSCGGSGSGNACRPASAASWLGDVSSHLQMVHMTLYYRHWHMVSIVVEWEVNVRMNYPRLKKSPKNVRKLPGFVYLFIFTRTIFQFHKIQNSK